MPRALTILPQESFIRLLNAPTFAISGNGSPYSRSTLSGV